jgi:hypothetical protein
MPRPNAATETGHGKSKKCKKLADRNRSPTEQSRTEPRMLRGRTDRDVVRRRRKDWKHEFVICSTSRLTGQAVMTLIVPRGVDEKEVAFLVVVHGAHRVVP